MTTTHTHRHQQLPRPSSAHATCAWCRTDFATIVALLAHVDQGHTVATAA
jgi:hypothetical protein